MNVDQILARMQDLYEAANVRADGKMTADEQAEFDSLERQANAAQRTEREEGEKRSARVAESRSKWGSLQPGAPKTDPFDIDVRTADSQTVLSRARGLVGDERNEITEHLTSGQRSTVDKLLRTHGESVDNTALARQVIATSREEYRTAFMKFAAGREDEMSDRERRAVSEVRSLSIGTPGAGGFAVPVVIDPTVILTAQESPNPIMRKARVEKITTDKWKGLASAGMAWNWRAEGASSTDNSPTVTQPTVQTYRADGFIPYSIEVEMDWPSFASNMAVLIEEGYNEHILTALTTGNAANTPKGIIPAVVAAGGKTVQVATSAVLATGDVYGLWKALPIKYRSPLRAASTGWMSSTDIENKIRQFGAGASADANFTANMGKDSQLPQLFNRDFLENDYMKSAPAVSNTDELLLVGDFRGYLVAQRMGMTVERLQMMFDAATGTPTGQRGFIAYARLGADVVDTNAFRLLINK